MIRKRVYLKSVDSIIEAIKSGIDMYFDVDTGLGVICYDDEDDEFGVFVWRRDDTLKFFEGTEDQVRRFVQDKGFKFYFEQGIAH